MKKFEIGKEYSMSSIYDHNCVWSYIVTARTAQTVTVKDTFDNSVKKCRVIKVLTERNGHETISPLSGRNPGAYLYAN